MSFKYAWTVGLTTLCQAMVGAQTLQPVVISASRAEQRSFDAPAAITSIGRDSIERAGPQVNLSESLNRVPGLTILNRQNYAQDLQLSIRGFGARSAFGIRGVRILVDGIPATTPDGQGQGSSISLTSTERIEVLRGPLAQLYGNSSGGVIQAFTRNAPEHPELLAQYYAGSYGMHRSDLQYAGRVGSYGLVADYGSFDTHGYRDHSDTQRRQFNGKLTFDPSDATRVNVVYNRFDMPLAQDPLGLTAAQMAANPTQAGNNAMARGTRKVVLQNQLGTSLVHTIDGERSVTARLYYGTRENLQFQTGLAASTGAWVGLDRDYYGTAVQYNQQVKLGGSLVRWVVGYEFDRSRETRQGGIAALGQKKSTTRNEDNTAANSDLFAQATALLSEHLSMVAGLRYSTVYFTSRDHYLIDGDGSGSVSYRAANPVLGLTYHAADSLNVYANYGRGFETPTLAEVAYSGTGAPAFNTSLDASRSQHYEMGAKWLPDPLSRVDFTLFRIESRNELVVASSSGGNATFKNAPGTRRSGGELAGNTLLTPHVRATLAASWIDATYSRSFTSGATPVAAGNKIPGIPQSFVHAELRWAALNMNGGDKNVAGRGTEAAVEWLRSGRLYANDTNSAVADGYSIVNLNVSHGWPIGSGSLTAYARIDNLTDRHYAGSVIVNQAASQFYEPAPGRNWTLGVRMVLPL